MHNRRLRELLRSVMTADLRSLALFRISVGSIILVDLFDRLGDIRMYYTDSGILPRDAMLSSVDFHRLVNFQLMNGSLWFQYLFFGLLFLFAISFVLGYRTRFSTVGLWLLLLSLQARNAQIGYAVDVVLRLGLLWGIFLPLGERFSLDRALNRGAPRGPNRYSSVAVLGLFVFIVSIYLFTAILKSHHDAWLQGRGLYFALSIDEYVMPLGLALLGHPALIKLANHGTMVIEAVGWVLLFIPWKRSSLRLPLFAIFAAFHCGMGLCLNVVLFQFAAVAIWTCVLPQLFWVYVRRFFRKKRAVLSLWRSRIASSLERHGVSGGSVGIATPLSLASNLVACSLIAVCLYWNLFQVQPDSFPVPDALNDFVLALGLDQKWDMFADPANASGWFVMPGVLDDGTMVDLFRDGGASSVEWEKPDDVYQQFRDERARKMILLMSGDGNDPIRLAYGRYLCRSWNDSHEEPGKKLDAFKIYMMNQMILPEGGKGPVRRIQLWRHECGKGMLERWKSLLGD